MGIKSDNGEKDYMKGGYIKTTDFKTVKEWFLFCTHLWNKKEL